MEWSLHLVLGINSGVIEDIHICVGKCIFSAPPDCDPPPHLNPCSKLFLPTAVANRALAAPQLLHTPFCGIVALLLDSLRFNSTTRTAHQSSEYISWSRSLQSHTGLLSYLYVYCPFSFPCMHFISIPQTVHPTLQTHPRPQRFHNHPRPNLQKQSTRHTLRTRRSGKRGVGIFLRRI